jgi:hypothetical protein
MKMTPGEWRRRLKYFMRKKSNENEKTEDPRNIESEGEEEKTVLKKLQKS